MNETIVFFTQYLSYVPCQHCEVMDTNSISSLLVTYLLCLAPVVHCPYLPSLCCCFFFLSFFLRQPDFVAQPTMKIMQPRQIPSSWQSWQPSQCIDYRCEPPYLALSTVLKTIMFYNSVQVLNTGMFGSDQHKSLTLSSKSLVAIIPLSDWSSAFLQVLLLRSCSICSNSTQLLYFCDRVLLQLKLTSNSQPFCLRLYCWSYRHTPPCLAGLYQFT